MRTKILAALLLSIVASVSHADQALAMSRNCMACHAMERKVVGPSLKDISARYAGQKDAVDKLTTKVLKGGTGVWGPVAMPANPQVSEADARKLTTWILSLK